MSLQKPGRIGLFWEMEAQGVTTFVLSNALPMLKSQDKYYFTSGMPSNYSPLFGPQNTSGNKMSVCPPLFQSIRAKPFYDNSQL